MEAEEIQVRVHGAADLPTLVYLPGLHGDWTLVGGFRRALAGRVRFVEMTYPRTLTWSLQDYADAAEAALLRLGIERGWVVAESFGSQIVWPMAQGEGFKPEGVILAGGFGRHPMLWGVRVAEVVSRGVPFWAVRGFLRFYRWVARWRFRGDPEILASLEEFVARRTERDRQAAVHRLRLIRDNDPGPLAEEVRVPVYGLTGWVDPIVPWVGARRWLQANCPALREFRVLRRADHTLLSTGPREAAEVVAGWMGLKPRSAGG